MTMASRMAVMSRGRVVQVGSPGDVYESPNGRFVADFIGAVNLFEGRVAACEGGMIGVSCASFGTAIVVRGAALAPGTEVAIAVRPEKIELAAPGDTNGQNRFVGIVREIAYRGEASTFHVALDGGKLVRVTLPNRARGGSAIQVGSTVSLRWPADAGMLLTS